MNMFHQVAHGIQLVMTINSNGLMVDLLLFYICIWSGLFIDHFSKNEKRNKILLLNESEFEFWLFEHGMNQNNNNKNKIPLVADSLW